MSEAIARRAWPTSMTLLLGFSALVTFVLPFPAAQAQYFPFPWYYPYYDGYPAPVPPGPIAGDRHRMVESARRMDREDEAAGVLPLSEIRRQIALLGFHLLATPRHNDRIYLVEAEDAHGLPHRLVVDAHRGTILENTKLAPFTKKSAKSANMEPGTSRVKQAKPAEAKPPPTADQKEPTVSQ